MRLRRRLGLDIAAARGVYTFVRPILVTLACRAASTAALRGLSVLSSSDCSACSHFFCRPPLCSVRFYCIRICFYFSFTIRVSRRPTVIDKRRITCGAPRLRQPSALLDLARPTCERL